MLDTPAPNAKPAAPAGPVQFTLNGRPVETPHRDHTLLDVLRDDFDMISPKNGCQPMGQCGCCTILIDGKPRLSCTLKPQNVAGKSVTTLEGLPDATRSQISECFVRAGGVQCGFCIPGIALRAHTLCENGKTPTRGEIEHELRAHLCRCTGYTKIVDAVELLGQTRAGTPLPQSDCRGRIAESMPRFSGHDAVLGQRRYIDDIKIPGMLHAAPRLSDHPRALVKKIDATAALALPGVLRVVTARDVPGDRIVGLITKDWPIFVAEGEETRYVGDVIAFAVATDVHTARAAAAAIIVEYEERPPLTTPDEALKRDAPQIHAKGNLLSRAALTRGNLETAFAQSAHIYENTWQTQTIEHMFLECEASIAVPLYADDRAPQDHADATAVGMAPDASSNHADAKRDGMPPALGAMPTDFRGHAAPERADATAVSMAPRSPAALRILTQGQGIFDDRRQIASVLGWPIERVQAELVSNGGAFGGKEDMSVQAQTALCAFLTGRPVKCVLTRAESLRVHPKRHPIRITLKVGCDAGGKLTAVRARIIGDKGAYASVGAKVLERAAGHAIGPYKCDTIDIEALAVYTNNPPNGAMRGFGVNQSAFAFEGALDALAAKVGIDGWEMRFRNILRLGDRFCTGQKMVKPFGLEQTLLAVRDAYRGAKFAGIACGIKNVGIGNGLPEVGRASMTIETDGTITIRTGHTEMGQGLFTVAIQAAVQETGLPYELLTARADTTDPLDSGQTTGSRGTVMTCHAIIDACKKLNPDLSGLGLSMGGTGILPVPECNGSRGQDQMQDRQRCLSHPDMRRALQKLAGRKYLGQWTAPPTDKFGADKPDPNTHLTYGFATQVCILDDEGRVRKIVAAHDVGKVINPVLLAGQLEGSLHMGLGYALTEEMVYANGRLVTDDVKSCGVLRAHHMPELELIVVEVPDADCPFGARGVAEIGLVPTAPAVAGALAKFEGFIRTTLPMKDSKAAEAMRANKRV